LAPHRADFERGLSLGFCLMKGSRTLLTRRPTRPRSAGSRVTDAIIVTATMIAEAQPILVIIEMPDTWRPAMASTTVVPAKRTA
jgi:hypothetical protein